MKIKAAQRNRKFKRLKREGNYSVQPYSCKEMEAAGR